MGIKYLGVETLVRLTNIKQLWIKKIIEKDSNFVPSYNSNKFNIETV